MTTVHVDGRAESGPAPRLYPRATQWAFAFAATVASTYALDAVATAAGILIVASQLLHGLERGPVLLFLVSTYVVWWIGLRANLAANWALLENTGTSVNALSKAAYDLVGLRTRSIRMRRLAASAGYVGTELAKETPYYFGAFGAALVSESVSANDALIFLGGANLGAAAYEYALARLTGAFLRRRDASGYASFEKDWRPQDYLAEYYGVVEPDESATIAFFVDAMREADAGKPVLVFGVGPTLHHVCLAAGSASEIHLGDYLAANLGEIRRWIARDPDAHDWRPFVRHTLECEGLRSPTDDDVREREELTRAKITELLQVDLRRVEPCGAAGLRTYATVISAYCADSATADRRTWKTYMERIASLVQPGGTLLTAALRRSHGYRVGGKTFPSANVDEDDLRAVLEPCFADVTTTVCELAGPDSKGYSSIVLAQARGRRPH